VALLAVATRLVGGAQEGAPGRRPREGARAGGGTARAPRWATSRRRRRDRRAAGPRQEEPSEDGSDVADAPAQPSAAQQQALVQRLMQAVPVLLMMLPTSGKAFPARRTASATPLVVTLQLLRCGTPDRRGRRSSITEKMCPLRASSYPIDWCR